MTSYEKATLNPHILENLGRHSASPLPPLLSSFSSYSLPRKVALNALHTFSSDGAGDGGISFAPFSPLSISRAAAPAAAAAAAAARGAIAISTESDFLDETHFGFFQIAEKSSEGMHHETARGRSKRRENCEMGRWRWSIGAGEGVTFAVGKEMWKRVN